MIRVNLVIKSLSNNFCCERSRGEFSSSEWFGSWWNVPWWELIGSISSYSDLRHQTGQQMVEKPHQPSSNFTLSWSNHLFDLYTNIFSIKSQNRSAYYYLVTQKIMFRICFVWMMFSVWASLRPPPHHLVSQAWDAQQWRRDDIMMVVIVAQHNSEP